MAAGAAVFAEKGYDAATMTEIAARSRTAAASLYRFFPSKEALANALLVQYGKHILEKLEELRSRAGEMTIEALAGALIDFKLELGEERKFAVTLAESGRVGAAERLHLRKLIENGLAEILHAALPSLETAKLEAMAVVLKNVLKGVAALEQEKPARRRLLLVEMKELVHAYLISARDKSLPAS